MSDRERDRCTEDLIRQTIHDSLPYANRAARYRYHQGLVVARIVEATKHVHSMDYVVYRERLAAAVNDLMHCSGQIS